MKLPMKAIQIRRCTSMLLGAAVFLTTAPWSIGARAADEASITTFSAASPGDAPATWKFVTLPNKTATRYSVTDLGGTKVLKVESDDSYGNLVHALHVQSTERSTVAWRWRVDKLIDEADLKSRSGEDSAAKLCVFFDFDSSKLSLGERTRLSIARSTTGQDVPVETLCYVWDNKLPVDTSLVSAFTKRIRFIVVQSGSGKVGQWVSEKRNVLADYQRMFSDESEGKAPVVTGVSVSADADNTHGHGLAYFGDVVFTP